MTHPGELELAALVESADPSSEVSLHVSTCSRCSARLAELRAVSLDETLHPSSGGGPSGPNVAVLEPGAQLGRYTILERIGAGGMGEVYAAYDPQLDRRVALKLLRADLALRADGAEARTRLLREAQSMARLSHPSVVTVHDVGLFGEEVFVAMEFVEGGTLAEWVREKPRSSAEILEVFLRAGEGLAAAHDAGLVHRDFKPTNVLIGRDGRVRVLDFGLARPSVGAVSSGAALDPKRLPDGPRSFSNSSPLSAPLTQAGAVVGTPGYSPPEQLQGEVLDPRVDQFSFCATLFEALYGRRPFEGQSLRALADAMLKGPPSSPPQEGRVHADVYRALCRGLAPRMEDRFSTMRELLRAIQPAPARSNVTRWAIAAGVLLMAGGGVGAAYLARTPPCEDVNRTLEAVWTSAAQQGVRKAFASTGKGFAARAADGTIAALDVWASSWRRVRTEACEATRVRAEEPESVLALRAACLELRLDEMRSLLEVLHRADADVAQNALGAVSHLPAPESCLRHESLLSMQAMPKDPAVRAQVEALRSNLATARAVFEGGKYAAALELAAPLADKAAKLQHPPIQAEVLLLIGAAEQKLGAFDPAAKALHGAARAALAAGDQGSAARAWTLLASVAGSAKNDYAEADEWLSYAQTALSRAGNDAAAQAELLHLMGVLYMEQGRYSEALQRSEAALRLHEEEIRVEDPLLVRILDNLAYTLSWLTRHEEAVTQYERALAIAERLYGPEHPEVGILLDKMSTVLDELDQLDRAEAMQRRALALLEAALGAESLAVAETLNHLALVQGRRGEPQQALAASLRSIEIATARLGPNHARVGAFLHTAGSLAEELRAPAQAMDLYQRSYDAFLNTIGPQAGQLAYGLTGIGTSLLALNRAREAVPPLERAVALHEKNEVLPLDRGKARAALARALWVARRDADRVRSLVELAREDFRASQAKGANDLAALEAWIAAEPALAARPQR